MIKSGIVFAASVLLVACGEPVKDATSKTTLPVQQSAAPVTSMPTRDHDITQIVRGAAVFKQNCATCHGANGEGAPNWRKRDANDKFPAPPLTGGGHTWHHPLTSLRHTIRNGTLAIGGSMPGWKDKLSNEDIDAVIVWFQSKWPDQAYAAWYDIDQRARKRKE